MEEEQKFLTIGEVSELLNIPKATLRFWQKSKIFDVKRDDNEYRKYSVSDLINIAEVAFYRYLGISVKEMRHFYEYRLEDYREKLDSLEKSLQEKMKLYHIMLQLVKMKQSHLKTIEQLSKVDFMPDIVPFDCVIRFDYNDREKLIRYAQNPSLYVRCINSANLEEEMRGIAQKQVTPQDHVIWKKRARSRFVSFLISEIATEGYRNDIDEKLRSIQKRYKTGALLAMFLLSEATHGKRIDYLKGFVEIFEKPR